MLGSIGECWGEWGILGKYAGVWRRMRECVGVLGSPWEKCDCTVIYFEVWGRMGEDGGMWGNIGEL